MKETLKTGIKGFMLVLIMTLITGIGAVSASAETLSADLDGDGIEEKIEWSEESVDTVTINGKQAFKGVKLYSPFTEESSIRVEIIDTATKDKYKEVCVQVNEYNCENDYYLFRYKNGKITKYAVIDDAEEIVSQKNNNRIKIKTYRFVYGIGNIRITKTYKVKKGETYRITKVYKPNEQNETKTFVSKVEMVIFKSRKWVTVAGTLKPGEKFTLVKFDYDAEGYSTRAYIKTESGIKGWINTSEYDCATFMVENPPLWG
ncbi:MAG: hypothetical protein IK014_02970 [Lachnospiraceae bacterium]|nr:hypothetical protein [Lachnospiraceae bacterium]